MKTLLLSLLAVSLLSGCASWKKGGCCNKDKSCCSKSEAGHEGHKGHKDCGSECGTEKKKTEEK